MHNLIARSSLFCIALLGMSSDARHYQQAPDYDPAEEAEILIILDDIADDDCYEKVIAYCQQHHVPYNSYIVKAALKILYEFRDMRDSYVRHYYKPFLLGTSIATVCALANRFGGTGNEIHIGFVLLILWNIALGGYLMNDSYMQHSGDKVIERLETIIALTRQHSPL